MSNIWMKIESFLSEPIFGGLSFFFALTLAVLPILSRVFSGRGQFLLSALDWFGGPLLSISATLVAYYQQNLTVAITINALLLVYYVLRKASFERRIASLRKESQMPLDTTESIGSFRSKIVPPD